MAANATKTFWGFIWWLKHNPFKSIDAMNEDDLDAMSRDFQLENVATITTTDIALNAAYTGITWPKEDAVAGSGVTAVKNTASCEQSQYPDQHDSGG